MSWNYRVFRETVEGPDGPEDYYSIHEVYYSKKGKIKGWSEKAQHPMGNTVQELFEDLIKMEKACFGAPIIEVKDGKCTEVPMKGLRPEDRPREGL